jgi:TldD protein
MHTFLRRVLVLTAILAASLVFAADDAVFKAMSDELARSMTRLKIDPNPAPYFLSYRIEDQDMLQIDARYGALTQSNRSQSRYLYSEVRVGDRKFDNTNFLGSWQDVYNIRDNLVEENSYDALRHKLWLVTDGAYKDALENLSRKHAYLQTHPVREELPDFSDAPVFEHMEAPVSLNVDAKAWETTVRAAAEALNSFAGLEDWKVSYMARAATKRYLNSEHSRSEKAAVIQVLEVSATTQAPDGQRLTSFLRFTARDNDAPPSGAELLDAVKKMGNELTAAAAAPVLDEYAGPVLFSDYASAQLVSQLFVNELSPVREFVAAEDWMSQMLPAGKLAERLNRRVMPDFVTITDRPDLKDWKGRRLLGYQAVDDEGVASQAITLVDKGRLVTLPMGRQPTKKIGQSNGHARTLINQWTQPVPTNLFVKASESLPKKQLVEKLRTMAKEFGNEYGLLVTLLNDRQVADDYTWISSQQDKPEPLTAPVIVYKVYASDGRLEPVRGLAFDEANVRSLRDIVAMGKDEELYGVAQPSLIAQSSYPLAIETPSILVEEMELKSNPTQEPKPISPRPMTATAEPK